MIKFKYYLIEIFVLILIFGLIFHSSDPVIYDDSDRFLNGGLQNPPLYPAIIMIMQSLFKNLNSIIIFQTLFLGLSIIVFTRTVTSIFDLDLIKKTLIAIFLFLPTIKYYNNLLTEPLCSALSLLFVSFIIKLIFNFNIQNLFWSSVLILLLLLSRNQFIFLYPLILITYIGIYIVNTSKKTLVLLISSFLLILTIHNSLIVLNKHFNKDLNENKTLLNSNRGIFHFVFIDAIYISSSKDVELFKDEKLKKTFEQIFKEVDRQKASSKYYNSRGHFGLSFVLIRDSTLLPLEELASKKNISVMDLKKEISIKIIYSNFGKYLKLIFKKFYDSTWLFVFIPFFMLLAALIEFYKNKSNFTLLTIFISSFALTNHAVVYLFGRVQPRYLIYSDFVLLIFIFIAFSILMHKKQ